MFAGTVIVPDAAVLQDHINARLSNERVLNLLSARSTRYEHILKMADALSDGIVKQFPDKFTA